MQVQWEGRAFGPNVIQSVTLVTLVYQYVTQDAKTNVYQIKPYAAHQSRNVKHIITERTH